MPDLTLYELKKLAALILVRLPFVRSDEEFGRMAKASLREIREEAEQRRETARLRSKEREQWAMDKKYSPAPVARALTALGF